MATIEKNYAVQLDSTATAIDKHVEEKSLTGISSSIDSWITHLAEHDSLKMIAADLGKLKTAIGEKDGKKIATLMT